MGFSALSMIEILYFISLRLYCRQHYGGRHSKKFAPKKIDTISRLITKNQRHWPFVWSHAQNVDQIKNNNNSMLQAYKSRRFNQQSIRTNGWKAPTPTLAYPYLN